MVSKARDQLMPPAVLADFPSKVDVWFMALCKLPVTRCHWKVAFHDALPLHVERLDLVQSAMKLPGHFDHSRI